VSVIFVPLLQEDPKRQGSSWVAEVQCFLECLSRFGISFQYVQRQALAGPGISITVIDF